MRDEFCRVAENIRIRNQYFLLKIHSEYVSTRAIPGNFVMLSTSSSGETLLKRPFGIFQAHPPLVWVYYQVVGKGTRMISELKPGDQITMLGPLGNAFPKATNQGILMIAGGRGIAPLFFTIKKYQEQNKIILIYGAKSKDDLNLLDMMNELKLDELFLYTEDGSAGKKGNVITDINEIIQKNTINISFSCGPDEMLKEIHQILRGGKTKDYASLEALMGCGFGICGSCVVQTRKNGYKKVCSDGPVFNMEEIAW